MVCNRMRLQSSRWYFFYEDAWTCANMCHKGLPRSKRCQSCVRHALKMQAFFEEKNKLRICACCRLPASQAVAHSTLVKLRRMSAKRSPKDLQTSPRLHGKDRVWIGIGRTSSTLNMLHVLVLPLRPQRSCCLPVPAFSWATKLAARGSWETAEIRESRRNSTIKYKQSKLPNTKTAFTVFQNFGCEKAAALVQ